MLIGYGAIASVLPVWLLLAPRDYLSTFLKIGTILGLALGIVVVMPELKMPALTRFVDGSIAYGGMLMESFVAMMALVAAAVIDPGVYFAMNSPGALIGTTAHSAAQTISQWGFVVTPDVLTEAAADVGERSIISRAGGAPTLAVGMAQILASALGGKGLMAVWYHFAILFEVLFILTAVDAGTRSGRFMLQDLLGTFAPSLRRTESLPANLLATALCVSAWGFVLYQGVVDPLGGINSLWPLFGISNQMLAAIALILATVVLFRLKRERFVWVTMAPAAWLLTCTLTAGWQKAFHADPSIGFVAHAQKFSVAAARGEVLAPAASLSDMQRVVFNDYLDASLAILFMLVVMTVLAYGIRAAIKAWAFAQPTARETPYQRIPAHI